MTRLFCNLCGRPYSHGAFCPQCQALQAFNTSLSDAATERFARETLEGAGLHTLRHEAAFIRKQGGDPGTAFSWPSYFDPMKLPEGITRADVIAYIAEALEASQAWVAQDLVKMVEATMATKDLLRTLIEWIPDAEWWKAFDLISERQPHHSLYQPRDILAIIRPAGERASIDPTPAFFLGAAQEVASQLREWMVGLEILDEEDEPEAFAKLQGASDLATLQGLFTAWFSEEHELTIEGASPSMPAPDCEPKLVEEIKKGEYVKRKADGRKVYKRGAYIPSTKRYALVDCDDISREIYVRKGTLLFVGFTY